MRGETERGDREGDRESVQECEGRDRENVDVNKGSVFTL